MGRTLPDAVDVTYEGREKVQDDLDKVRDIEGFPLGDAKDLQLFSNPPYFTLYPNPNLNEFVKKFGTTFDESTDDYNREPFIGDIREGKNDPVYNAHTFHTKVPYRAITRFIEHYTNPGDIVLDAFCGSGMTGIAAVLSKRRAILVDLSPVATLISYNFTHSIFALSQSVVEKVYRQISEKVTEYCGHLYETRNKGRKAVVSSVVWSTVVKCPYCKQEVTCGGLWFREKT
jgi:hypothetical protein